MSLSLYWRRPPVDLDTQGGVDHPTKGIVSRLLFDHDGSLRGDAVLVKDSPQYHYLCGVRDTTLQEDVRSHMTQLLAVVERYGAAEVWTGD